MKNLFTTLFSIVFATGAVFAQDAEVSIATPYTQNFNGIGVSPTATLPTGWRVDKSTAGADARKVNAYSNGGTQTELIGGNNLSTGGGVHNFGAGVADEATDRAVGFRGQNGALRNANLYLKIKNTGALDIEELLIAYDIEKYKRGITAIRIQLLYSTDGETWIEAGSDFYNGFQDDDSNVYNPAPGETVPVRAMLKDSDQNPVSLAAGAELFLAWNYAVPENTGGTNNSPALGIDNVVIGDYATLPLKFTSFNAKLNGLTNKQVLLTWTTEQELNTNYFEIGRAGNNNNFEKIGTLAAANSGGQHSYSFTDIQPLSGVSYYRIKQVDKDGKYTYSEIKSVKDDVLTLAVYPNPATHSISVTVPQSLAQGKLVIYSSTGEKIFTKNNVVSTDKIDVSQFDAGFYLIEISQQNHKETAKFLKQ